MTYPLFNSSGAIFHIKSSEAYLSFETVEKLINNDYSADDQINYCILDENDDGYGRLTDTYHAVEYYLPVSLLIEDENTFLIKIFYL